MASTIKPITAFFLWTVTSFLCHKLAKMAVDCTGSRMTSLAHVIAPLIVTVCQTLTCYFTVNVSDGKGPLFTVIAVSHFAATLATNTSFTLIFASSTMAFKLLEPVTSAFIQSLVIKTPFPLGSIISMLVITGGAVLFVGNPFESSVHVQGTVMALLSNVILGIRNASIKLNQTSNRKTSLSSGTTMTEYTTVALALCMNFYILETYAKILPEKFTYFAILALSSSVFHVMYSYVSTNVVLRYMSVVSHAIANVIKRVLVVLLLYMSGQRSVSLWNWGGLVLCTCGLLVYNKGKLLRAQPPSQLSAERPHTRSQSAVESSGKDSYGESESKHARVLWSLLVTCLVCYGVSFLVPSFVLSEPSYAKLLRHGMTAWRDGQPLFKDRVVYQPTLKNETCVRDFLQRPLLSVSSNTDALSPYLTTSVDVIAEAQRIQLGLLSSLVGRKKFVILIGLVTSENKGDPAIAVGELRLIEKLNLTLLYYIDEETCYDEHFATALKLSLFMTPEDLVLFGHGGGNLIGYGSPNECRKKAMEYFPQYQMIILSQSFFMDGSRSTVERMVKLYCCNPRLTIFLRDRLSFYIASRMFTEHPAESRTFSENPAGERERLFNNGTRLVLAPDMAFHIGLVSRFSPPHYDILWLKRLDDERLRYDALPRFPGNVSVKVADWWKGWDTAHGSSTAETANNVFLNGLIFLQRGRVVITERLHGHILATLLDIPHVLLDNKDKKLSAYHNTWTRGLRNVRLIESPEEAVKMALELLKEYDRVLPKVVSVGYQTSET